MKVVEKLLVYVSYVRSVYLLVRPVLSYCVLCQPPRESEELRGGEVKGGKKDTGRVVIGWSRCSAVQLPQWFSAPVKTEGRILTGA